MFMYSSTVIYCALSPAVNARQSLSAVERRLTMFWNGATDGHLGSFFSLLMKKQGRKFAGKQELK